MRCVMMACTIASVAAAATPPRPPITGVSHIAVYAAAPAKSERFYVHDLGGVKGNDPENTKGVRYYFAPTQFVEVLPLPASTVPPARTPDLQPALVADRASINRLDHVAFTTTDAQGLLAYLAAKQIPVPHQVETGRDGSAASDPRAASDSPR